MKLILFLSAIISFFLAQGLSLFIGSQHGIKTFACFIVGKIIPVILLGFSGGVLMALLVSGIFG